MEQWLSHVVAGMGVWAYVVIGLGVGLECAALIGLVIPGESLAILGGFLASRGPLDLWVVLVVVAGSAIVGDSIGFEMGRRLGRGWLIRVGRHLHVKAADVERVEQLFRQHGGAAVAIARFLTFGRAIAPYVAGTSGMRYPVFLAFNALGGIGFAAAAVLVGYGFAGVWRSAHHWIMAISIVIAVAVVVGGTIWVRRRRKTRGHTHSRRRHRRAPTATQR